MPEHSASIMFQAMSFRGSNESINLCSPGGHQSSTSELTDERRQATLGSGGGNLKSMCGCRERECVMCRLLPKDKGELLHTCKECNGTSST